jgi:hypothetical protein
MSANTFSRRALLSLVPAMAVASITTMATRDARADESAPPTSAMAGAAVKSRVVRAVNEAIGTTLTLELEHAPFPAAGFAYRDATVIAFVPKHFRPSRDGSVSVIVHFHGHSTMAERAMNAHQLREQLFDSKQNAILLVPEIAVMAPDSAAGKLETPGAFERLVADALRTLDTHDARAALGPATMPGGATIGRVIVSAHSGGYHAAALALKHGGVPVREVYLFDALYADVDVFRDWVISGRGKPMSARHKLVSYFTAGTTEWNTKKMFAELSQAGVDVAAENVEGTLSREELTHAEAVSIRTSLAHGKVTSELNGLRDCLYASALRRNLRTSWFDAKTGARPLERRR